MVVHGGRAGEAWRDLAAVCWCIGLVWGGRPACLLALLAPCQFLSTPWVNSPLSSPLGRRHGNWEHRQCVPEDAFRADSPCRVHLVS